MNTSPGDGRPRTIPEAASDPGRVPRLPRGPLSGLQEVAEFLADEERASVFLRGLTIGALVGAAIAGSRIWRRRQHSEGPARRE